MHTLVLQRTSKAVAWIVALSMAFAFAAPQASAFQSRGATSTAKWVSQMPGAAANGATVVNAEGGDVLSFGLTIQNTSATDVFYSADQLADEPAPYVGAHEFRVGATSDFVYDNIFDFSESNFVNNNRFATFQTGPAVMPGQNLSFNWQMTVKDDIADGTYRFKVGVVQEYDAWLGDAPAAAGPNNNLGGRTGGTIFWDIVIGDGGSTPSGDLEGGAGDITVDGLSTYANEEVGQDAEDVEVAAFEIEADEESDVEITSLKVELFQADTDSSQELDDYMTEVSVWMDGEEVGRADVDEFSENSDVWSKSISLDDAIVRMGENEQFVIAVSALNNLDSGDYDDDYWYIGVSSLRFMDGEGVTTTETLTLDIDENHADTPAVDDEVEQAFQFTSFGAAEDVELVFALNDDDEDINEAHVIDVDTADTTDDVELLSFTIEAEGNSDINISELHSLITVTEATNGDFDGAGDIVTNVTLWWGEDEIASDTLAGAAEAEVAVFEDLDIDIEAGETEEFMIKVDLVGTDGVLGDGDTVMADFDATRVNLTEAKDETGEDLTTSPDQLTGTADGEASTVYASGIMVDFVSASATRSFEADATGEEDIGTFEIVFDVTAFDGGFYLDRHVDDQDTIGDAGEGVEYEDNVTGTVTPVVLSELIEAEGVDSQDTADVFRVDEDTTRRFTVTVLLGGDVTPEPGSVQIYLESIGWGSVATDATNDNNYTFNLGDFKTPYLFLNGIG